MYTLVQKRVNDVNIIKVKSHDEKPKEQKQFKIDLQLINRWQCFMRYFMGL